MGIFDKKSYNNNAMLKVRKDDKPGTYWQRIDKIAVEPTRDEREFLKIYKTTVRVLDSKGGRAQLEGAETTQGMFPDKYSYFERETKQLMKAIFGLTTAEANKLTGEEIEKWLVKEQKAAGLVVEVNVSQVVKKKAIDKDPADLNADDLFTQVNVRRSIDADELKAGLGPETYGVFFPTT